MGHMEFSCLPWETANKNSKESYIVSGYIDEKQRSINTNILRLPFFGLVVWKNKRYLRINWDKGLFRGRI